MKYIEFLEEYLDFYLQQIPESGSTAAADKERQLRNERGKLVVTDSINYLISENHSRYCEEYTHVFNSYTTMFEVPDTIMTVISIKDSSGRWFIPEGNKLSGIRLSGDKLYNPDAWQRGDTLTMLVKRFHDTITGDDDVIVFPKQFMQLLVLDVKRTVYDILGKEMTQSETSKYQMLLIRWKTDNGKVRSKNRLSHSGKSFGDRRR